MTDEERDAEETGDVFTSKHRLQPNESLVYTLVEMAGGWFPIGVFLLLSGASFAFMFVHPEHAPVVFGFIGTALLPIVIGHQAWKTRQNTDVAATAINSVSRTTTANVIEKMQDGVGTKIADQVASKVIERVDEKVKSAIDEKLPGTK
jgi:hypothetical protein